MHLFIYTYAYTYLCICILYMQIDPYYKDSHKRGPQHFSKSPNRLPRLQAPMAAPHFWRVIRPDWPTQGRGPGLIGLSYTNNWESYFGVFM